MKKNLTMMLVLLSTMLAVPFAAAAQQHSNIANTTITMNVGESITIIPPTQAVTLNYTSGATSTPPQTFQITTLWQLASTHTLLDVNWWFASSTSALSNGAGGNIPSSEVFSNINGSAYSGCTAAADPLVPGAVSGSTCNVGLSIHLSASNYASQETDTIGLEMQGLPLTLAAGTYTGTLNIQAGTN